MDSQRTIRDRHNALDSSYRILSEDSKRQISQATWKNDPDTFKTWAKVAQTGYRDHAKESDRPPGVGPKLDRALLSSERNTVKIIAEYFKSAYSPWLDFVASRMVNSAKLEPQFDSLLEASDRPWLGDPMESLFRASIYTMPDAWFVRPAEPSALAAEKSENVTANPKRHVWEDHIGTLSSSAASVQHAIGRGLAALPFDLEQVLESLRSISAIGASLRGEVASIASAAKEEVPEWNSIEDLRMALVRMSAKIAAAASDPKQLRLLELANAISALTDVGSRTVRKRDAVATAKISAADELRQRAKEIVVPILPFEGEGDLWLEAVFDSRSGSLEDRVQSLSAAGFPKLSAFLEESEDFARFKRTSPTSTELPVSLVNWDPVNGKVLSSTVAALAQVSLSAPALDASENKELEASVSRSKVLPGSPPATTAEPGKPDGIANPPPTAPEPVAVMGVQDGPAEAYALEILELDSLTEARVLLPDKMESFGPEVREIMPPTLVVELIALQPWIRHADSETGEEARTRLAALVDSGWTPHSEAEALMAWAAAMLPAFVGAGAQANGILFALAQNRHLPSALSEITRITTSFLTDVPHCSPEHIVSGSLRTAWSAILERQQEELISFCDSAHQQTINYQKATLIWRKINGSSGRLRELANRAQGTLTDESIERLRDEARTLASPRARQRLIDSTSRSGSRGYTQIDGAAFEQLSERIAEFTQRLERLCDHAANQPPDSKTVVRKVQIFTREAIPQLHEFLTIEAPRSENSLSAFGWRAAIRTARRVIDLFDARAVSGEKPSHSFETAVRLARLRIRGLRVNSRSGQIDDRQPSADVRALITAKNFLSPADAFQLRLETGDIPNSRYLNAHYSQTIGASDSARIDEARAIYGKRVHIELEEARREVINARTLNVLGDSRAQEHLTKLTAAQKAIEQTEDFWGASIEVSSVRLELRRITELEAARLSSELQNVSSVPLKVRERVEMLLSKNDLATAREYITRLRTGNDLPPMVHDDLLGGFSPLLEDTIAQSLRHTGEFDGFIARVRAKEEFAGKDYSTLAPGELRELWEWLLAWRCLRNHDGFNKDTLTKWLYGLRINPIELTISQTKHPFIAELRAETLNDRTLCAIPQFGSEAGGRYKLISIAQRQDPAQLVQLVRQAGVSHCTILLVPYRVEHAVRMEFARLCRDKKARGLLVDDVVMAFLSRFDQGRLTHVFKATAPYTWVDPYLPTTSYVPPEIFFGRSDALASLLDTTKQDCFVYGGRQLGKTALLREVARRFNQSTDTVALWVDLQAEDFGSESEPEEIWDALHSRFMESLQGYEGCWRESKADGKSRDEAALLKWMSLKKGRKVLLLLDESDRFLDRDAVDDYSMTRRLKGLMDRTKRDFKVVFAGLHNVQRSTKIGNHPLAHLGTPINIGAFTERGDWMEAYSLVVGPLAALGYRFESVDLPSRVLASCNFYPSLLQQFGHRLLERMRTQALSEPPFSINADDIDAIIREDEFRRFLTDRFQLTLQLDRRYYYLAYGFALFFHTEPLRAALGYTARELRAKMDSYRPAEFAALGQDEFESLLDEMKGLGVLQREENDTRYRLRNTNVLLLLGSPDEVLQRLCEDIPDLRLDYHSRTNRGRVHGARRRWLARPEENRVLDRQHRLSLIESSPIAESSGLSESLATGAGAEFFHTLNAKTVAALEEQLERMANEKLKEGTHVVLVSVSGEAKLADCLSAARKFVDTRKSNQRFFSVVMNIPAGDLWDEACRGLLADPSTYVVFTRRWEVEFVGPWIQEQSIPATSGEISDLIEVTDGWARLLHSFVDEIKGPNHRSWMEALETIREKVKRWGKEGLAAARFFGTGPFVEVAWNHLKEFHGMQPDRFNSEDIIVYSEIQSLNPSQMQHWVDVACRMDLVERGSAGFHWTKVFSTALESK